MSDNKVVIHVVGGVADVVQKPDGVEVEIIDFDNLEDSIELAYALVRPDNRDDYSDIYDKEAEASQAAASNAKGYTAVRQGYVVVEENGDMPEEASDIHFDKFAAMLEAYEILG